MKSPFPDFLGVPADLEAELLEKTRRHWHALDEEQRAVLTELLTGNDVWGSSVLVFWGTVTALSDAWAFSCPSVDELTTKQADAARPECHDDARQALSRLP